MAIVVIAIALSDTLLVVDVSTRRSAEPLLERQALSIGEAYLSEILGKAYVDPDTGTRCGPAETSRAVYDDVCDYDGLDELGARDQNGTPVAGLEAYRVRIEVDSSAHLGSLTSADDVVRVDARVTDPTGRTILLSAYRTNP